MTIDRERFITAHRQRSRNYPALSLGKTVKLAATLAAAEGIKPLAKGVIAEYWGKSLFSSAFTSALAALVHYGLIGAVAGKGKIRHYMLTELARRILDTEPGEARSALLYEALYKPAIAQEIRSEFSHAWPTAPVLRDLLITRKGFTREAAARFMAIWSASFEFVESDAPSHAAAQASGSNSHADADRSSAPGAEGTGTPIFFPLSGNNSIQITIQKKITENDWNIIEKILELIKPALMDQA